MRRAGLAAAWCVLVLLPLAGCGGDPAPAAAGGSQSEAEALPTSDDVGAPPPVEPCSLLSDEEMAGILSEQLPADEGAITVTSESSSLGGGGTCTYSWTRATWGEGSGKEFTIAVMSPTDLTFSAAIGERTPIEGVGDEAFVTQENYFARVGDVVVHLVNLQETPEASVAVLTAAAGKL